MDAITRHQTNSMGGLRGGLAPLLRFPGIWWRRSQTRRHLRKEVGCDVDRIQRLELDIGLPKGTLAQEMEKTFWQP